MKWFKNGIGTSLVLLKLNVSPRLKGKGQKTYKKRRENMRTLQERKLALEKELAELEVLERAAKIREEAAEKEKRIESLILSLKNETLFCRMPISSIAHVKTIFQSPICSSTCFFADTCQSIIALTDKKALVRNTGKKAPGYRNSDNIKVIVSRSTIDKNMIDISFGNETVIIPAINWKSYKENLKTIFPRKKALEMGVSAGQYAGFMHEKSMMKHFNLNK